MNNDILFANLTSDLMDQQNAFLEYDEKEYSYEPPGFFYSSEADIDEFDYLGLRFNQLPGSESINEPYDQRAEALQKALAKIEKEITAGNFWGHDPEKLESNLNMNLNKTDTSSTPKSENIIVEAEIPDNLWLSSRQQEIVRQEISWQQIMAYSKRLDLKKLYFTYGNGHFRMEIPGDKLVKPGKY